MRFPLVSRSCKECGGLLLGRIDQVYCSDACRTSANNKRVRERAQGMPECIERIQKNAHQKLQAANRAPESGKSVV